MYEANYHHVKNANGEAHGIHAVEWADPDDAHADPNRKSVLVSVSNGTITLDFAYGKDITNTLSMTIPEWYLFAVLIQGMNKVTGENND